MRDRSAGDFLLDLENNRTPRSRYSPAKPSVVKTTSPGLTRDEPASAVRNRPWTIQGWRPSSAVHHPAVVAMYGKGKASIRTQSIGRVTASLSRQSRRDGKPHRQDEERSQPDHDVIAVIEQLHVLGHSSIGKSFSPLTVLPNVPYARKLSTPGTTIGFSSLRSATLGWPISASSAYGPPSKSPSIAASVTG